MIDASAVHEVFDKSPLVNGRKDFTGEEEPETHRQVNGRPRSWNLDIHQNYESRRTSSSAYQRSSRVGFSLTPVAKKNRSGHSLCSESG